MKKQISKYDQQAIDFLKATGATISSVYTGHRSYFDDEKEFRATYMVTIIREGKPAMSFPFGQSMVDSWEILASPKHSNSNLMKHFEGLYYQGQDILRRFKEAIESGGDFGRGYGVYTEIKGRSFRLRKSEKAPSDYTILSALTKYDPETFDDFCGNYGYDTDSRKAETTYQAVRKEYTDLLKIFTSVELDQMSEIQ